MYSVTVRSYAEAWSIIAFLVSAVILMVRVTLVPGAARLGGRPVLAWM